MSDFDFGPTLEAFRAKDEGTKDGHGSRFGSLLAKMRQKADMSAAELSLALESAGEKVNKQYIAGLERGPGGPSIDALKQIILYFSSISVNGCPKEPDPEIAMAFVEAALGLKLSLLPTTIFEREIELQRELDKGDTFWLVSDEVAEETNEQWRELVALNLAKGVAYTYFFPFSRMEEELQLLGRLLEKEAGVDCTGLLRIFQLSNCAFPINMRITNPGKKAQSRAIYSLPNDTFGSDRVRVSQDQLDIVVQRLSRMLVAAAHPDQADCPEKNGLLKQVFPLPNDSRKRP